MSNIIRSQNLRFVVLKSPFQIWTQFENDSFKDLFHDMVRLKLHGYGLEYPRGVLPVDTSDLIATHLLVCKEEGSRLRPIMGFKTTALADCDHHQIAFPALGLVQAAESALHVQAIKNIITRCQHEKKTLSYTGSWTIEPALRKNRPLTKELIQLFRASYVFHHQDQNVDEVITGGTIRFKADVLLGEMGHDPLCLETQTLAPIRVKHLFGEPVAVLHLKSFSESAKMQAAPYRTYWDERIEISAESLGLLKTHRATG